MGRFLGKEREQGLPHVPSPPSVCSDHITGVHNT
jgi:hypothetical protein